LPLPRLRWPLTTGDATPVAQRTLLLLAPCAAAQLVGAAQAASLQLVGRFGLPAFAYTISSLGAVAALIALLPVAGVDAMLIAFAVNSCILCSVLWTAGARHADFASALDSLRALRALAGAASALAAVSAANVIGTAFLAGGSPGAQTIFAYAAFIGAVAYGLAGAPIVTVLASRFRADVSDVLPAFRLATVLTVPIVSAAATGGASVIGVMLSFGPSEVTVLRRDVILMASWASMTTLLALAASAIVVKGQARRLTAVTATTLGFHVLACAALSRVIGSDGPVLATGLAPAVGATAAVIACRPARPAAFVREVIGVLFLYGLIAAATASAAWYLAGAPRVGDLPANLTAALCGAMLYTVVVVALRRDYRAAIVGLKRS
jgi:hypothetical protein